MRLALCIFRYFPYGGLQKDFLRVARECALRGHEVEIFCGRNSELPEERTAGIRWHVIPLSGTTNHARAKSFERRFARIARSRQFDCVLGFNRMAGLDFYFAGDVCLAERVHSRVIWQFRMLIPRYRTFLRMERSVFAAGSQTRILALTDAQEKEYQRWYGTPDDRFFCLPIGFDPRCGRIGDVAGVRAKTREALGLGHQDFAVALIGSDFKRKGADRAIAAMAALPEKLKAGLKFFLIGDDSPEAVFSLAEDAGIREAVSYLGGREDVPELMCAMDMLVHPAREEAGGSVLIEAAVSRLPVICTDICGFSSHIEKWEVGHSVASPFSQEVFNAEFARFVAFLRDSGGERPVFPEDLMQYRRATAVAEQLEKFVGERAV